MSDCYDQFTLERSVHWWRRSLKPMTMKRGGDTNSTKPDKASVEPLSVNRNRFPYLGIRARRTVNREEASNKLGIIDGDIAHVSDSAANTVVSAEFTAQIGCRVIH
jgi:hypothetical protein